MKSKITKQYMASEIILDSELSYEKKKSSNVAVIFAGGSGRRMNNDGKPKQFLALKGKPIIIYTLELFEAQPEIDGIIVVCLKTWISELQKLIEKFHITKVKSIVAGGSTGQESIYNGLVEASKLYDENSVVLIHDGVRPLISSNTIHENVIATREYGSCITCIKTTETFVVSQKDGMLSIPERKDSLIARAPQSFILKDILAAHIVARKENRNDFIDSCSMMNHYGYRLHTVLGPIENIKITTPMDYFIFKTMFEVHEIQQVFGF